MTCSLNEAGEPRIDYKTEAESVTTVKLTYHPYFSLACGETVPGYELIIDADLFIPVNGEHIPARET